MTTKMKRAAPMTRRVKRATPMTTRLKSDTFVRYRRVRYMIRIVGYRPSYRHQAPDPSSSLRTYLLLIGPWT